MSLLKRSSVLLYRVGIHQTRCMSKMTGPPSVMFLDGVEVGHGLSGDRSVVFENRPTTSRMPQSRDFQQQLHVRYPTSFYHHSPTDDEYYDKQGSVSLYSVMQSNVPEPYQPDSTAPSHLNMPGGGQNMNLRYVSDSILTHQHCQSAPTGPLLSQTNGISVCDEPSVQYARQQVSRRTSNNFSQLSNLQVSHRLYCTRSGGGTDNSKLPEGEALSQKQRLKRAIKDYGATVIVFHIGISLISLGGFYALVSSGIDVMGLLAKLGVGQAFLESSIATGASTFVMAYAVHKLFVPVRMGITLTATPFIVRYLRRIGFLKPPKK